MDGSGKEWLRWQGARPRQSGPVREWPVFQRRRNLEAELYRLGLKPAVKLEDLTRAEAESLADDVARSGDFGRAVRNHGGPPPEERSLSSREGERSFHFVRARRQGTLAALLAAEALEREGGERRREAIFRSGELLGYPACCTDFMAGLDCQDDAVVVDRYRTQPGAGTQPWQLNIFPPLVSPVTWYPCSFDCLASRAWAGHALATLDEETPGTVEQTREALSGAVLVWNRFLFVQLGEPSWRDDCLSFGWVSDALSYSGEERLLESSVLRNFRTEVTESLAAGRGLCVHNDRFELEQADSRIVAGTLLGNPLLLSFGTTGGGAS